MIDQTPAEQMRAALEKLFQSAGYTVPELLSYIDMLEQDNAKLNQTIKKIKLDNVRRASAAQGMNSRLKDALRE